MEKTWNKSKVTLEVYGFDGEDRKRNLSGVIADPSNDQLAELSNIIQGLTGDATEVIRVTREDEIK